MDIKELSGQAHDTSSNNGFYNNQKIIKDLLERGILSIEDYNRLEKQLLNSNLMMIVTEVAEITEALRKDNNAFIKEEIADVFIRLFDLVGYLNIDIEKEIHKKMDFNKTRGFLHGKSF